MTGLAFGSAFDGDFIAFGVSRKSKGCGPSRLVRAAITMVIAPKGQSKFLKGSVVVFLGISEDQFKCPRQCDAVRLAGCLP